MAVSSSITITQNSQNISNNTSNITVKVQVVTSGSSHNDFSKPGTCKIDGTDYSFTHSIPQNSTTTIFEKTLDISHDNEGKKTVNASFSYQTGISAGTISGSISKVLTTIPRTSEVSLSKKNFNIGETITIYTNRKSASFTHTAVAKFNGQTVRTQTGIDASYSWNTNELFAKIPNQNQANGTVELTTYSGGTRIGTSTVNFTGYVVNSDPTFNNFDCEDSNSTTVTLTGNNQKYIRKYSSAKVTITSANKMVAKNSATAKYYNIIVGNKSEKLDYSTSNINKVINNMDRNTVSVFATDSRGNQTNKTKSLEIIDYSEIVIQSLNIERKEGVGEKLVITLSGKYSNTNFGAKTNSVKSVQLRRKVKNDSNYGDWIDIKSLITINAENGTFSCNSKELTSQTFILGTEYDIEIKIADELSSDTEPVSLNSGKVLLSALKNKGISVGGIYDENLGGPLQLDNKNVINWINSKQDKQKHILKAILSTDNTVITSTANWQSIEVPLNQYIKIGDKLRFENNRIYIATDVKYIKFSAKVLLWELSSSAKMIGLIIQGNKNYAMSNCYKSLYGNCDVLTIPETIIKVNQDNSTTEETIMALVYFDNPSSGKLRKYGQSTFLQVEVVDC
jgi:hypothetical protein